MIIRENTIKIKDISNEFMIHREEIEPALQESSEIYRKGSLLPYQGKTE